MCHKEKDRWTEREGEPGREDMQCFVKKEDKSLIDEENIKTSLFRLLCFLHIGLLFAAVLSNPSQSCFSRMLCNLLL